MAMQQYSLSPFQIKFIMNYTFWTINVIIVKFVYFFYFCTKIVNNVCIFLRANASMSGRHQVAMQQYSLSRFGMKFIINYNLLDYRP